jgi:hypothetical protein
MVLSDGGVYNNLATQWATVDTIDHISRSMHVGPHDLDELVIVDASAPPKTGRLRRTLVPVLGEFLSAGRIINVIYNATLSPRRREHVTSFRLSSITGEGPVGALIHITEDPFRIPRSFVSVQDESAKRAQNALVALAESGLSEGEWQRIARLNSMIPTTLARIRPDIGSRLLYHGYVLAMINLHVVLGYPLLSVPDQTRFQALVAA